MVLYSTNPLLHILTCYFHLQITQNQSLMHQHRILTLSQKLLNMLGDLKELTQRIWKIKSFWKESPGFKSKCEKLTAMSYDKNKILVENFEKEITIKYYIIGKPFLLTFQNCSTQNTRHPQAKILVDLLHKTILLSIDEKNRRRN